MAPENSGYRSAPDKSVFHLTTLPGRTVPFQQAPKHFAMNRDWNVAIVTRKFRSSRTGSDGPALRNMRPSAEDLALQLFFLFEMSASRFGLVGAAPE